MIRHLPFFVVVAEEQHFQRAAERLNIAQSALSRRIRNLEQELGDVPLFIRMPRGVRLTPSGEALLEDARRILFEADRARERAVSIMNGDNGRLRVGYSIGAVRNVIIGDLLKAFRDAFPGMDIETRLLGVEEHFALIRKGEIDAGILYCEDVGEEFASLDLAQENHLLALPASHRLAKADHILFQDIAREDFIFYPRSLTPTMHAHLRSSFEARGVTPRVVMESPTSDVTLRLVAAGIGLGFVTPTDNARPVRGVVTRPIEDMPLVSHLRMVWLRASRAPMLPRLIDAASTIRV